MRTKAALALSSAFALSVLPSAAFAATTIKGIIGQISGIINMLIPIVLALAVLGFFWGLAKYIFSDGEDKKKGLNIMGMGLLAIFVMVSLWGLIGVLQRTFKIDKGQVIIPDVIERNYRMY